MNNRFAYVTQGSGIDLDRVRQVFGGVSTTEYANSTVFVEQRSVDPMALRLQQALSQPAKAEPAVPTEAPAVFGER